MQVGEIHAIDTSEAPYEFIYDKREAVIYLCEVSGFTWYTTNIIGLQFVTDIFCV